MLVAYSGTPHPPTDIDRWEGLQPKRTHTFVSVCVAQGTDPSGVADGLVEVFAVVRTATVNIVDNIGTNL